MSAQDIYDSITVEPLTFGNIECWDAVFDLCNKAVNIADSHELGIVWNVALINHHVIGAYASYDGDDIRWIVNLSRVPDYQGTVAVHKMIADAKWKAAQDGFSHISIEQSPSHWLIASLEDEGFRLTSQTWTKPTRANP